MKALVVPDPTETARDPRGPPWIPQGSPGNPLFGQCFEVIHDVPGFRMLVRETNDADGLSVLEIGSDRGATCAIAAEICGVVAVSGVLLSVASPAPGGVCVEFITAFPTPGGLGAMTWSDLPSVGAAPA